MCHCVVRNLWFGKTNSSGYFVWDWQLSLLDEILRKNKNSKYIKKNTNIFVNTETIKFVGQNLKETYKFKIHKKKPNTFVNATLIV